MNTKRAIVFGIPLFWTLFAAFVVSFYAVLGASEENIAWQEIITWNIGWLLWGGVSFLVIWLTRRYPIRRQSLKSGIARHLALGFAIAFADVILEFGVNYIVSLILNEGEFPWGRIIALFLYKFHIYLIIYWAIVGATTAFDYYSKFRESEIVSSQLETELAVSQLNALKMQLHPHFLFNTHHSIVSLIMEGEYDIAIKMLTRLSDLLRMTLEKTNQQMTTLKEELDALDLYLSIQKERFLERLKIDIETDNSLKSAEVPFLLLQPLVENALKHGIGPKTEGGRIYISAKSVLGGRNICLVVDDDGLGMDTTSLQTNGNGIGLKNTKERLERLFPDCHSFNISSEVGRGTRIEIQFPNSKNSPANDIFLQDE